MADITLIALEDLENDRGYSLMDIKLCEWALLLGMTKYSGGESVRYRLDTNKGIVNEINKELERRQNEER